MVSPLQLAGEYLLPPTESFWEWSKVGRTVDGEAIAWRDGRTIAFREELRQVLELLAPRGLPPLGCIVLVLAAARDNWKEAPSPLGILHGILRAATPDRRHLLGDVVGGLERIASLPTELRSPPRHKAALVETITESVIRTTPEETEAILDTLRPGIQDVLLSQSDAAVTIVPTQVPGRFHTRPEPEGRPFVSVGDDVEPTTVVGVVETDEAMYPISSPCTGRIAEILVENEQLVEIGQPLFVVLALSSEDAKSSRRRLLADLRLLRDGLVRFDAEAFRLRLDTGLEELPEAAEIELPPAERVRALLTSLEQDHELAGLARLARQLMAAVTLPRPVSEPDELPIGGVSDITNRGPLDRLLLSELAHDDLTLAVRVAVNEALYLRREAPPKTPPRQRALLLDSGIRTWGVPRVYATAVALALAATADEDHGLASYRADGTRATEVDLTTREGLVEHLGALSTHLHPGEALPDFSRQLAAAGAATEPVLIVTDDTLRDAEFQRALDTLEEKPVFIASVSRDGRLEILERGARGSKRLRSATLDLGVLLPRTRQPKAPLIDPDAPVDLPAIFGVEPFPLLLPHTIDPERVWRCGSGGVLTVTHDLRLMHWTDRSRGAAQITDRAPEGRLWWSARQPDADGLTRAVVGNSRRGQLSLLRVDLDRGRCEAEPLPAERGVRAVAAHHGTLLFVDDRRIVACSETSGEKTHVVSLPAGMRWIAGRFFRAEPNQRWHALAFDGAALCLQPILNERAEMNCPRLTTFFERDGVDGPIGVSAGGHLYYSATGKLLQVKHGLKGEVSVVEVAPGGGKLVLRSDHWRHGGDRHVIVDVVTREVETCSRSPFQLVQRELRKFAQPRNVRHRFSHVFVEGTVSLSLVPSRPRSPELTIRHDRTYDCLRLQPAGEAYIRSRPIPFQPVAGPPGSGYKLRAAVWPDGSRAVLDSRGLLHLKSADPDLPETTIVLCDGPLSGWSSDGRVWGLTYFTGVQELSEMVSAGDIFKQNIQGFVQRLP